MNAMELKLLAREWAEETQDCHVPFDQFDEFIDWVCAKHRLPAPIDTSPIFEAMKKFWKGDGWK